MTKLLTSSLSAVAYENPTEQLMVHLQHYPTDLIDIRQLMHRYQVSWQDVHQALQWLESQAPSTEEETQ